MLATQVMVITIDYTTRHGSGVDFEIVQCWLSPTVCLQKGIPILAIRRDSEGTVRHDRNRQFEA
jgi:hypothetical protein